MKGQRFLTTVALLWIVGVGLRLTILAVPPVLPAIQADLHLSGTLIGILNGLPVVFFAIVALPGSLLIARLGPAKTLAIGLLITGIASSLRGAMPSVTMLFTMTIIMSAGVALMQPAMPAAVRAWMPDRIGFGTAVYTNGLLMGEIIPVALMLPVVLPLVDNSWRWGLAVWALPVVLMAATVMIVAPRLGGGMMAPAKQPVWWPDWRSGLIWRLGFLSAGTNSVYFGSNGFLPNYLTEAGRPDLISPALTALNLGQLPASILLLAVASRLERHTWPFVFAGLLALIGVIGVVTTASAWTVIAAACIGFSCATALVLGLTLPPLLCDTKDVPRVSAAMFTISYMFALVVSVIGGAVWDFTGMAASAFLPVGVSALMAMVIAATIRFDDRP